MECDARGVMCQIDTGDCQYPTFLGMPLSQWWRDLEIWEWFLNEHHFGQIIEVGTYCGGMATFFALQCHVRGMQFTSLDVSDTAWRPAIGQNALLQRLVAPHCVVADFFTEAGQEHVLGALGRSGREPILVFCDNGDKPREYKIVAPYLKEGDVLAMHDWSKDTTICEFHPSDVNESLTETIWGDLCDRHNSHTRFFKKRSC